MRLISFIALFFASICLASPPWMFRYKRPVINTGSSITYLYQEYFESSPYDLAGWTNSISGVFGTNSPALQGAQSLYLDSSIPSAAVIASLQHSSKTELYYKFQIQLITYTAGTTRTICYIGGYELKIASGKLRLYNGGSAYASFDSLSCTAGTTYTVWLHQKLANPSGISEIAVSTTTKPAYSSISNGTGTGSITQFRPYCESSASPAKIVFDSIQIAETDIP